MAPRTADPHGKSPPGGQLERKPIKINDLRAAW
jgi:hypothetical protein